MLHREVRRPLLVVAAAVALAVVAAVVLARVPGASTRQAPVLRSAVTVVAAPAPVHVDRPSASVTADVPAQLAHDLAVLGDDVVLPATERTIDPASAPPAPTSTVATPESARAPPAL